MKKQKLLFYYRIFIYFVAVFFISKFTYLGDYNRYINGNAITIYQKYGIQTFMNSTSLTEFIVGCIRNFFLNSKLLAGIVLNILSTYAIVYFLQAVKWNKIVFLLILMPSFTIWSSYPSKELFSVIATAFVMGNIIKKFDKDKITRIEKVYFYIGLYLLFVYKKQYFVCIIFLLVYLYLKNKLTKNFRNIVYILYVCLIIVVAYISRDYIDNFFRNFHIHFDYGSKETVRNLYIFREKYGFFKYLFYGIFIAFFGVSFRELFQGGLKLFSFMESLIIVSIILYTLIKNKMKDIERLFLCFNGLFLLLLPQYPFAIFNSGSAIRYRTNLYILVLGIIYIFILKNYTKKVKNRYKYKNTKNIKKIRKGKI